MARFRVLLVDDREGRGGPERVRASERWDLVVVDLSGTEGGGLELVADAKRLAPRTPVLVVSACEEDDHATRALRAGADGYVLETRGARELLAAIGHVTGGGRYVSPRVADGAPPAAASAGPHRLLSRRELQVLRLVAVGRTLKEVAAEMRVAERTVATYRARIGTKLGLSTNVQLARYALQHHLVD